MSELLDKLRGGDRRSIGRSPQVVAEVLNNPQQFAELFAGMLSDDPLVRMRAADAVEKISAHHPDWLHPFTRQIIEQVALVDQQEVRWHVAQMFPRLSLTASQRTRVIDILISYLADRSAIVKTFSMQALADLAEDDDRLRPAVIARLEKSTATGTPAMRSRGRKLLIKLKSKEKGA